MDCIAKTVTCWSHHAWVTMTLYYPQFPKGGIPPELHPAVQEDKWLAEPGTFPNKRGGWKKGQLSALIAHYLAMNGPQIISTMADDLECTVAQITGVLTRNPQKFYIAGYRIIRLATGGATKAAIWGVIEKEATN